MITMDQARLQGPPQDVAKKNMEVAVTFKCLDTGVTGSKTIVVVDWEKKCVRDLKYAIQEVIDAPVCDQKLSHREQLLSNDSMPLLRTYHRQGEAVLVEFPARANIHGLKELIKILKKYSQILDSGATIRDLIRRRENRIDVLEQALERVCVLFTPWKSATAVAQRHYFVQEGGFDAFMSIFRASKPSCEEENVFETPLQPSRGPPWTLEEWMHHVEVKSTCLSLLWLFCETGPDRKFAIQRGILPLVIDAFLTEPMKTDWLQTTLSRHYIEEEAVGPVAGLVEYDADSQLAAAGNTALIEKLVMMADLRDEDSVYRYKLFSKQVACNTLCYCTFNPASIPVLVELGVQEKGIDILRDLLLKNEDVPLIYYWCIFLARLRSSHLVELGRQTDSDIDKLITSFVDRHQPSEITTWEVEKSYVWITMVPLMHLALAGGRYYYENASEEEWSGIAMSSVCIQCEDICSIDCRPPAEMTQYCGDDVSCSDDDDNHCVSENTAYTCTENIAIKKMKLEPRSTAEDKSQNLPITVNTPGNHSESERQNSPEMPAKWPGSHATRRLGLFILEHMLYVEENRVLFLSENLLPHAIYLSWVLRGQEKESMKMSLLRFGNVSTPSLKDLAKSVLAQMHGLDSVILMKM